MDRLEQIGKITLDYSKYAGQDFYCDGAVEDELLELVKTLSPEEYDAQIKEKKSWPILYHLSPLRENIVDWIPMEKSAKVLEVGSGCGAVTGAFARKCSEVTCVDLSRKRSLINAYRHKDCDNVTIHVGNFKDIEPDLDRDYDYICLIGVFEYGYSYIGGDTPYEDFLNILLPHLAPGGRIVIAIENKYGLKYFAGCKEDHLDAYFAGIENYTDGGGVRTFSRRGLERIFKSCNVPEVHFYYPYPDYKFMHTLYSDAYLPGKGELCDNLRNFDNDRMLLFDEKSAFDGIAEDGLFQIFSNSYVAVLGGGFDVKYVKYSNDRAPEYAIKTEISRTAEGEAYVRKYPLSEAAKEHVRGMAVSYDNLLERYEGGRLEINRCRLTEEPEVYVQFEYVNGTPLSELMEQCLAKKDLEGFYRYFEEYIERVGYHGEYPVADFDLIFSNLLVDGDVWTLIDYEWTFGKPIDIKELAFRAVYYYFREEKTGNKLNLDLILNKLNLTKAEADELWEQEKDFQRFVAGEHAALGQMIDLIGRRTIVPQKWIDRCAASGAVNQVQIYEDTTGEGYSEENSYFVKDAYQGETLVEFQIPVGNEVKMLRIDPAMDTCMVKILEMTWNGQPVPLGKRRMMIVNGQVVRASEKAEKMYRPSVVFPTTDPNINVAVGELPRGNNVSQAGPENELYARMEIAWLSPKMAQDMAEAVKKLI